MIENILIKMVRVISVHRMKELRMKVRFVDQITVTNYNTFGKTELVRIA